MGSVFKKRELLQVDHHCVLGVFSAGNRFLSQIGAGTTKIRRRAGYRDTEQAAWLSVIVSLSAG